jgi:hypothetical protein
MGTSYGQFAHNWREMTGEAIQWAYKISKQILSFSTTAGEILKNSGQWHLAVLEQVHTSWSAINDTKASALPLMSLTRPCSTPSGASPLMTLVDDAGYSPRGWGTSAAFCGVAKGGGETSPPVSLCSKCLQPTVGSTSTPRGSNTFGQFGPMSITA